MARRMTRLFMTGDPSSEMATQPASNNSPDFRKFFPFRSFGNGTDGKDPGFPGSRSLGKNKFRNRPGIVDGHGIGHATHRGKATGYSRRASRGNRFLMLEPGLSKMNVQIHKPGTHEQPFRVDPRQRLRILKFSLKVGLHRADFSIFDQHVGHAVPPTWVDDLSFSDKDFHIIRHAGLPAVLQEMKWRLSPICHSRRLSPTF